MSQPPEIEVNEILCNAPPENRGLAVGAYTASLALGLTGSLLGFVASGAGLNAVVLTSGAAIAGGAVVVRLAEDSIEEENQ